MKRHLIKILFLAGTGLILWSSCKKDESKVYFNGGTAPVLTASVSDSIPLPISDSDGTALTLNWTNPNYTYSNGVSSLSVTYYLEIDTLGAGFGGPNMQSLAFTPDVTTTMTVSSFNALLSNKLLLQTGVQHSIQMRVEAFISPFTSGSAPAGVLYSDTLNFTVTPYTIPPTVAPPATGTLYITGSATADGWMVAGQPATVAGQQLTQVSPTLYTITLPLIGGQQFLLVPLAGDWTNKYATASSSPPPTGGSFGYNAANNFVGPLNSGTYTVTVNFQTGTYTITQ